LTWVQPPTSLPTSARGLLFTIPHTDCRSVRETALLGSAAVRFHTSWG